MLGDGVRRFVVEFEPGASRILEWCDLLRKGMGGEDSFKGEGSGCKATPPPPPLPFEAEDDTCSGLSVKLGFGGKPATPNPAPVVDSS